MPTNHHNGNGLAKIADATAYLQVSRTKLYRMMRGGDLPYVMIGQRRRIPWTALRNLALAGTTNRDRHSGNASE